MNIRLTCLALLFAAFHSGAHAELNKCVDANGRTSVQDTPCPSDPHAHERKRPIPGTRDPAFAQRQKDSRPDANWDPGRELVVDMPRPQPRAGEAPVTAAAARAAATWQEKDRAFQQRQAGAQARAEQPVRAPATGFECARARQQVEVVNTARPVYRQDSHGNRHYISDENRQAEITAAERRMADACH